LLQTKSLSLIGGPVWRLERRRGIGSGTGVGEWEGGIDEGSDDGASEEDDSEGSSEERNDWFGERGGGDEGGEGDVCGVFGKGEEGDAGKGFGKAGGVTVFDREAFGVGEKELGQGISRAKRGIGPGTVGEGEMGLTDA
jgi:hypothetical protein